MIENTITKAAKSHQAHEQNWERLISEKEKRFFTMKNKDCAGYILNIRTLEIINPLLKQSGNTWLTVGDYNGFEAHYLEGRQQTVIATDISDIFLKEALNEGLIQQCKKENVENLSFGESTFDYVSCRESFHHFPRAYMGIYEMLRVAKKGIVLIEPVDVLSRMPLLLFF